MKELEDTHCEVRRIIEIHASIHDGLNTSGGEEFGHSAASPTFKGSDIPLGGFLEDANYAWLANGPRFIVTNARTGENIASWTFRDTVTCVSQFPTQPGQVSLLLVGLDNGATRAKDSAGTVCVFDCSKSRIVRTIRMPAGVEQIRVMHGGTEWEDFNEKRTHGILTESSGLACIVLRNLYHLVIDLRRTLWDGDTFFLNTNESSPTDVEFFDNNKYSSPSRQHSDRGRHLAYNLMNTGIEEFIRFNRDEFESLPLFDENLTTALIYSKKLGCLISACLGRIIIWQNDGSVGWISPAARNNMSISHLALIEPSDDPRPFYYLWVAYQEESFETAPILRMYALLIEKKYCDKETNMLFKIEIEPSVKFELQLETADRITGLVSIERANNYEQSETNSKKGEESLLLIAMSGKALLFDLNQWYKEQMPRNIRDNQDPNIFLSRYRMKLEKDVPEETVLDCAYSPSTLREYPSNGGNSLEELFHPKSLCLDWIELTTGHLRIWMTRGLQWELLREMAVAGPSILIQPSETFHRCLAAGLVPFNTDCSLDCDQNAQREMLLSLCLEQRWAQFLIKCAKEWSDGSVSYLFPMFLRWGAQRASALKLVADQLCIPLFDQSGSNIGDTEIKLLRFCSQQLECLSNVVARLPIDSEDLIKQRRALRRVATHLGVLLWFYDVGLLPETHEINEETLPITFSLQIPYPYERLAAIYRSKREQIRKNGLNSGDSKEELLFIDELMTQECPSLRSQWEREGGDITTGGYYPPPSLQSLLRSYLVDCCCSEKTESDEMENKHQITIYLLMDLVKLLQGSCPDVDQLIKYPSAFKMSPSLIKLTQAFWLLDHEDYQGFLDTLTGQLVSDSDVKDWHHKIVMRTLMRNKEYKLALTYLRVRKPPLSAIGDQITSINLSVECGLVQTAFHQRPPSHYRQLLSAFFQACKACGRLTEILQLALDPEEEEAFVKFLEENKSEETRLLYYLQRCRYTEAGTSNQFSLSKSHLKNFQSAPLTMVNAYNATLPKVTKALSSSLIKKHSETTDDEVIRYPRPMSHRRNYSKNQGVFQIVLNKVKETYVRGDTCQIPFISAPCTSLKFNTKNNSSCVLFPNLAIRTSGKRSLDEMREDEGQQQSLEESKRRKISRDNETLDNESSIRKLGTSVAFETPLIQRKRPTSESLQHETETPHSILKIRQLIQSSTSPRTLTRRPIKQDQNLIKEEERKPARQIRFSIGQPMNDSSSHEESALNVSNETTDKEDNASVESEEVFYSPNTSGKSHSTDGSSYSVSSIRGPRPRPSLRSSGNASFNESLLESRDRDSLHKELKATPLRASLNQRSLLNAPEVAGPPSKSVLLELEELKDTDNTDSLPLRCSLSPITSYSLSNESRYSSRVLPSDSSFLSTPGGTTSIREDSLTETRRELRSGIKDRSRLLSKSITSRIFDKVDNYRRDSGGRKPLSIVETSKFSTTSHSSFTKTTTVTTEFNGAGDEEVMAEVDDFGLDHEPEFCFADSKQAEKSSPVVDNEENNVEESDERSESMEVEEQHGDKQQQEDKEESVTSEDDNQPELLEDTDDYEAELFDLNDKDEDENDECFQSLTNSAASGMEALPDDNCRSENQTVNRESLGFQKRVAEILNLTEDESSNDTQEENEKIETTHQLETNDLQASGSPVQSKHNMTESNFTEDESNSSIEHFELIADDSDLEEDVNSELTLKKEVNATNTCNRSPAQDVSRGIASISKSSLAQTPKSSPKKSDDINKSEESEAVSHTSHENACLLSETESAVSTVSVSDVPSWSGAESTKNSPQDIQKKGKSSANSRSRQKSKSPTPVRMTRARRASSAAKEISILESSSSTMTVECPEAFVSLSDISSRTISSESNTKAETTRPKRTNRRSASVDKEVTSSEDVQANKAEPPLRRSTRRAASAQRDMPTIPEVVSKDSKLAAISETTDLANESTSTSKRSQRSRKPSVSSQLDPDETLPARNTRSSSVSKDSVSDQSLNTSRTTRKRGNSVPKETAETSRSTRASSLAKDTIIEEATRSPSVGGKRKSLTLAQSTEDLVVNSPAKNTRSRRLAVESIPENEELMLSSRIRERSSSNASNSEKLSSRSKARDRRAVSLEPSKAEVKKRSKNRLAKSVITEEPIAEETEDDGMEGKSKTTKKKSTRKRTESTASSSNVEETTEKVKGGRKTSQLKIRDSNVFLFSQPEVTEDPPNNQQEVEECPPYVFSPPQTRARDPVIDQLRSKGKHFISPLTLEEKRRLVETGGVKTVKKEPLPSSTTSASRTLFTIPKRKRKPSTE